MTTLERRLASEWILLEDLAEKNPGRISGLAAEDLRIRLILRGTPAFALTGELLTEHPLRIDFPRFFPAAPMELSLDRPMQHPNIHPTTGFVCLWDRHRVSNTIEHALHKTVAMLGWHLWNPEPQHVMQPEALERLQGAGRAAQFTEALQAEPLVGVTSVDAIRHPATDAPLRRRLS